MMSVNNIDFNLGSYNPNQAVGLIAMARENDRQISSSLKGILDGFEKTARENADVQAMNYINSLDLEDMTPDKMAGHTQALQQIAGSMGGLNPSKEALTALDGRGNVLTQRANNLANLEAQNILNQGNQIKLNEQQNNHILTTAYSTALANPNKIQEIKASLPIHLQGMFDNGFEVFRLNQRNELGKATESSEKVNESIEKYRAETIFNKLRTVSPNFIDANGNVDYTKLFADKDVQALLGETMYHQPTMGRVLHMLDAQQAEQAKAALQNALTGAKIEATRTSSEVAKQNANTNQMRAEQEVINKALGIEQKKQDKKDKELLEQQKIFNKNIGNTHIGRGGAVQLARDGEYSVDKSKLTANFVNSVKEAGEIKSVVYKEATPEQWWINNSKFGSFEGWAGSSTIRDIIKTKLDNYVKPNGKKLTKDEYIGMAEILKADMKQGDIFGSSTLSNRFPNASYVKKGSLDVDSLYATYNINRKAEADNRVREVSMTMLKELAELGLELDLIKDSLPSEFIKEYSNRLDKDVLAILTGTNALDNISKGWTNNLFLPKIPVRTAREVFGLDAPSREINQGMPVFPKPQSGLRY